MKKLFVLLMGCAFAVMTVSCAACPTNGAANADQKPGVVIADVVTWTGTVKGVDYVKRTATLQDESGQVFTVNAKNVRNLDQVKIGDKVKIEHLEETAIYVTKADSAPSVDDQQTIQLAPKGQKPGGYVSDTVRITANVEAIDYQKRTLTLKGPAGNIKTFTIGESVKRFNEIKKGDQVVVKHTEALAISVTKF